MMLELVETERDKINQLVGIWYAAPTVLISSSDYKRRLLQTVGFSDVDCFQLADDFEIDKQQVWDKREFGTFHDSRKSQAAVFIAQKKLGEALRRGGIDGDAFAFAFDTMPHIYVYRDENVVFDVRSKLWNAVHMAKPRNLVGAKKMIRKAFEVVLEGEYAFRKIEESFRMAGVDPERLAMTNDVRKWGHLPRTINVMTGWAARLPGEQRVETCSAEVRMELQALYPFLSQNGEIDREGLGSFVEELVAIQGDRVLQISGGVDYADLKVRELLKLRELSLSGEMAEEGIWKGVPIHKLREWLLRLAKDRLGISTVW